MSGLTRAGLILLIAVSGCHLPTDEEKRANGIKYERMQRIDRAAARYDWAFRGCINAVTGFFSSASVDVMRHCEARACQYIEPTEDWALPIQCKKGGVQ